MRWQPKLPAHGIWLWKIYSPHLPRTPGDGDIPVSAGAAVITPQRRFTRAPQSSPQVFRRPWGSIFNPYAVIAPWNATFGYQADVDRSEQSYSSPPGAVHLRGVPDSLVHRLCTGNAVYEIVKLHIGRMFFPQWVGTDTLHLLSVIQKFFYFFKSLCNSTSGTMPKTCYINLTITIHKK